MPDLLLGCGNHRQRVLTPDQRQEWRDLVTLDNDPNCGADIECDLSRLPLPFDEGHFDEIHAYHVLEHVGAQGDFRTFFDQFAEFYRILKPGGYFCGIVPTGVWVWGDPGHSRALPPEIWTYLDQTQYTKQVGVTAFADYRRVWRGDFEAIFQSQLEGDQYGFVLQVVKPSRISV